ncbi:unnamed protein product [Arctia plantaginis]|uniref:Rab-GAP TBC domain-containing protein n=1 Tax=Arctia plantaginis TaxID=874455 RepID=A0A8S0ZZD5_ARCPL|nr:unnamed protein product [Arctia plantaginis]
MQPTQHLLNYMLPVIGRAERKLAECLDKAQVGTMFALPWYLTWFGHSLNKYTDVVRLYDYFLCAPPLFPVYVTAAIVLYRADEVYNCECDMAMLHCLLSRLPDDLPFEDILVTAERLYEENDPIDLESEVQALERREEEQRRLDEERLKRRRVVGRGAAHASLSARVGACVPAALRRLPLSRRAVFATATVLLGIYVYYRPDLLFNRRRENSLEF